MTALRYLLALGSSLAAVQLAEELRAAFAGVGHREAGPPVLLSHHVADAARAADAEAVIVARTLAGDLPAGEAIVALRQALPRARIVVLLGTPDEEARELARQAAHGAAVFDLLPGAVRPQDVLAALEGPRRTYQDVRGLIEAPGGDSTETAGGGGRVVTVLGAAPGCGAATVAANLCFLLAGEGHAVEALDLREYPRLVMLLHADQTPGGGRRRAGLRDVGVTELQAAEDPVPLIAATARRAKWTVCLPPPDPRDPRTAAALVAARAVWLVVTPEPWAVQTAAGWLREGRVHEPRVILNRHVPGLAVGPPVVQSVLGLPCAAVMPEDPATHWEAERRATVAAELEPRRWQALLDLLPDPVGVSGPPLQRLLRVVRPARAPHGAGP